MKQNITPEQLAKRLPLLNAAEVCRQSNVDYMRFRNWRQGRVKSITCDELQRIADVLSTLHHND